jgi:tRNA threonylcarbamoyl adenosine modification protein YjeE
MSDSKTIPLNDPAATEALAARLARLAEKGDVLALAGDLGAGKTLFARAFIRAYTGLADEEVPSPTFTLAQVYEGGRWLVWHFDLYRLDKPEHALELGLEEAIDQGVVLIEWPERLGPEGPRSGLALSLEFGPDPQARLARLADRGGWAARLERIGDG